MKQVLDIERLASWAYREELAKRATSSAEGIWGRLSDWRSLGVAVDVGGGGSQRYDLGLPHPDALLIEQVVGSLPDAVIDWRSEARSVLGDLLGLMDPGGTENAPAGSVASRRTVAGWIGRRGGRVRVELEPPRSVILVRSLRTSALVTMHALMGTCPDWIPEAPRPQYVPADRGPGPKIVGECRARNWYTQGSYCPLRWEPSPLSIAEARADYLAWWRGLDQLAGLLMHKLARFHPLAPASPEMPWRDPAREAPWGRPRAVRASHVKRR